MELRDHDDRIVAAGEYVLGLLPAAERREFEQAAQADPTLRGEVHAWERRLAPLAARLAPMAPRPIVWLNILHALASARAPVAGTARFTRSWAMLATAASLLLGFALYRQTTTPPPAPVVITERVEVAVPGKVYVAQLEVPKSTMHWSVSVSSDRKLAVLAGGEAPAAAAAFDAELWLITAKGPVSLGVIPKSGEVRHEITAGLPFAPGATLAVSLEPKGGSTTGAPTGPVITSAALLQAS